MTDLEWLRRVATLPDVEIERRIAAGEPVVEELASMPIAKLFEWALVGAFVLPALVEMELAVLGDATAREHSGRRQTPLPRIPAGKGQE